MTISERTGESFVLGLWGPRARAILEAVTDADVSNEAFPYMTARYLDVGEVGRVHLLEHRLHVRGERSGLHHRMARLEPATELGR